MLKKLSIVLGLSLFASAAFAENYVAWTPATVGKTKAAACIEYDQDGNMLNNGDYAATDRCRAVQPTTFQIRQSQSGGKLCYEMTQDRLPVLSELNNFGQVLYVDMSNCNQ